jgi:hypothetical protein
MRKLMILIAAVAALGVMSVSASAASAAPHWYVEGEAEPIEEGFPVEVSTSSEKLVLEDTKSGAVLTCAVEDMGTIVNPLGGGAGEDEVTSFVNSGCALTGCPAGAAHTLAENPHWHSVLFVDEEGNIRDEISGIDIRVFCGAPEVGHYTGTLKPKIVGSDAVFDASAGFLMSTEGTKGVVTGSDHIESIFGPITAQNP